MKHLFAIILLCACFTAIGQTKRIAHWSHSGNEASYRTMRNASSNFGVAPTRIVRNAVLDSLIFLNEHQVVMVTSEFCHEYDYNPVSPVSTLWKAGRDTLIDHPLFSYQHRLDSIKTVIKTQYNFKNPKKKVRFIGYDNNIEKEKPKPPVQIQQQQQQQNNQNNNQNNNNQESYLPLAIKDDNNGSGPLFFVMLAAIVALIVGFCTRKIHGSSLT